MKKQNTPRMDNWKNVAYYFLSFSFRIYEVWYLPQTCAIK
jgi:hypothetical protein